MRFVPHNLIRIQTRIGSRNRCYGARAGTPPIAQSPLSISLIFTRRCGHPQTTTPCHAEADKSYHLLVQDEQ
jgi:hypothetical protein